MCMLITNMVLKCSVCQEERIADEFSKTQRSKGEQRKCIWCLSSTTKSVAPSGSPVVSHFQQSLFIQTPLMLNNRLIEEFTRDDLIDVIKSLDFEKKVLNQQLADVSHALVDELSTRRLLQLQLESMEGLKSRVVILQQEIERLKKSIQDLNEKVTSQGNQIESLVAATKLLMDSYNRRSLLSLRNLLVDAEALTDKSALTSAAIGFISKHVSKERNAGDRAANYIDEHRIREAIQSHTSGSKKEIFINLFETVYRVPFAVDTQDSLLSELDF